VFEDTRSQAITLVVLTIRVHTSYTYNAYTITNRSVKPKLRSRYSFNVWDMTQLQHEALSVSQDTGNYMYHGSYTDDFRPPRHLLIDGAGAAAEGTPVGQGSVAGWR
jgi:hypothetical protein